MARANRDGDQGITIDHVKGKALDRLLSHSWPVAAWLAAVPVAWVMHANWPGRDAALLTAASGVLIAALTAKLHAGRSHVGRHMPAVTVSCAYAWVIAAGMAGVTHAMAGLWFIGGLTMVLAWMIRSGSHGRAHDAVTAFEDATEDAGLKGIRVIRRVLHASGKETGELKLPGGQLAPADVSQRTKYIEGARGLPPGSIIVAPHEDHAAKARYTITDPRTLKKGFGWPGPSAPGKSITEPIVPGRWQDGEPCRYVVVGHHVQEMGMTGAGKSTGACWNEAAETITRYDAAFFGIDYTKGRQFLGPLEAGLHALITDPEQGREFFADVHRCVKDRADYLADHGYAKWMEGCGLTHLTFGLEEAPDIITDFENSDDDLFDWWMSDVKAFRSAGGRWKISLQRSDFTQMPTLARGQVAKWCFGVDSAADADFGMSPYQKSRDCQPEIWGTSYPGMYLLDAPTIPEAYKAMPGRCWYWGEETGPGSLIRQHAEAYPAAARPLDPVTASHLGKYLPDAARAVQADPMPGCPGAASLARADADERQAVRLAQPRRAPEEDMEIGSIWEAPAEDDDDLNSDVSGVVIGIPEGSPAEGFEGGPDRAPERELTAEEAKDLFLGRLEELAATQGHVTISDIEDLAERAGKGRTWLYYMIGEAVKARILLPPADKKKPYTWAFPRAA